MLTRLWNINNEKNSNRQDWDEERLWKREKQKDRMAKNTRTKKIGENEEERQVFECANNARHNKV
jgi:hypothetical protein